MKTMEEWNQLTYTNRADRDKKYTLYFDKDTIDADLCNFWAYDENPAIRNIVLIYCEDKLDPIVFEDLSNDPYDLVRLSCAERKKIPADVLNNMKDDENFSVLYAVLYNKKVYPDTVDYLYQKHVINCDEKFLEKVIDTKELNDFKKFLNVLSSKLSDVDAIYNMWDLFDTQIWEDYRKGLYQNEYNEYKNFWDKLENQHGGFVSKVIAGLLVNPHTPTDLLDLIFAKYSQSYKVLELLAKNKNTSVKCLKKIAKTCLYDKTMYLYTNILANIIKNPAFPENECMKLLSTTNTLLFPLFVEREVYTEQKLQNWFKFKQLQANIVKIMKKVQPELQNYPDDWVLEIIKTKKK